MAVDAMTPDLTGTAILITGATDGLGRGLALALAQRGATLLVHGRDRARGEAVVATQFSNLWKAA